MSWTSGPNGGNNLYTGDDNANNADGQAGNDTLYGAGGADTLLGGAGNDSLVGDIGAEEAPGRDSLIGDDGNDTLLGGLENDTLIGGAGDDSIHETTHVSGNDSIDLGEGDDRFLSLSQNDRDIILGGGGNDTVFLNYDQHTGGAGSTIDGGAGDDSLRVAITASQTGRNSADFSLSGGAGNDTLIGFRGRDSLLGGDGDDWVDGGAGNDRILTSAGQDSLAGGAGNDTITWSGAAGDATIDGGADADTLDLGALFGGSAWTTGSDGSGGTIFRYNPDDGPAEATLYARNVETVLCYAAGTRIATPMGEVPIETLRVGDLVRCAARGVRVQPILWIGRIEARLAGHPHPERAWPVLIRAGGLGAGLPRRDLRVSPDHGIFLEGVLVPAKLLVNGTTIVQERWWAEITYLHLELPEHAILLAEGLPAESWLDDGRRDEFDNAGLAAQFVDFGLELAAARPEGNFAVIRDPAAAARIRDRAVLRPRPAAGLTWAAGGATKLAEDTKETRHAPPPVRWRQRRHPDRAEA